MKQILNHADLINATLNQPYELYAIMMMRLPSPNGLAVEIYICEDVPF
jgi:hypothetical protein